MWEPRGLLFAAMLRDVASLLIALSALAHAQNPGVNLSVYLSNPDAASPVVASTIRAELRELMGASGIGVAWHDGSGSVEGRLAVVRFEGICRSDAPNPLLPQYVTRDPEALGSTHVSNGDVLPFADVKCDQIRRFVAIPISKAGNVEARDEMLGRAVARVIAHELYHIVLRTKDHGKKGLARATQTASQLVSPRLAFSHEDERRLSAETAPVTAVDEEVAVTERVRNER